MHREGQVERTTKETRIKLSCGYRGGSGKIGTGVPFLDHMLTLLTRHGLFDLTIAAKGTWRSTSTTWWRTSGSAWARRSAAPSGHEGDPTVRARGRADDRGAGGGDGGRFRAAAPGLQLPLGNEKVGTFDVELVEEFLRAFAQSSGVCLHVNVAYGSNAHHTVEAVFKALGRALSAAVELDPRVKGVPSTKGVLG